MITISSISKIYEVEKISGGGVYSLLENYYDVLIMFSGTNEDYPDVCYWRHALREDLGKLSLEQIDTIIEFVRRGGGLILGYMSWEPRYKFEEAHRALAILLRKLGIKIEAADKEYDSEVILEKGKEILEHPITVDVDMLRIEASSPVTKLKCKDCEIIITSPIKVLAKRFGEGRVVFFAGHFMLYNELSAQRFSVNVIEWVAGYMPPPSWDPGEMSRSISNITGPIATAGRESQTSSVATASTVTVTVTETVTSTLPMIMAETVTKITTKRETVTSYLSHLLDSLINNSMTLSTALALVAGLLIGILIAKGRKRVSR